LNYYNKRFGLNIVIFRISNIYGEGLDTSKGLGVINTFLETIKKNNQINIFGDGEVVRNYIYIKDVVKVMSMALFDSSNSSKTYNLSSDDSLSINELVLLLKKVLSTEFNVLYFDERKSDNPIIRVDNSKLKEDYKINFTKIEVGIKKTFLKINS
jgi:UDP-glucose 4-epimerase